MKKDDLYVVFAGFSDQNWLNIGAPDFKGHADGLTTCKLDYDTGELTVVQQSHGVNSPSTMVVSKDQKYIYCTNETHDYKGRGNGGGVSAFSFDIKTGETKFINDNFAFGSASAYISMDKEEKYLLVANHGSKFYVTRFEEIDGELKPVVVRDEGVVCLFKINEDRSVGKVLDRFVLSGTGADPVEHASAHPHCIIISDDDYIIIPNKGGDNVYLCKLNREKEKIEFLDKYHTGFGTSPRHAAFIPGTDYVVVIEEYGAHLNSFRINKQTNKLEHISRIDTYDPTYEGIRLALFDDYEGIVRPWAVDVQVHPDGHHLYVNNTQPNLCVFDINRENGELTLESMTHDGLKGATRGIQIDKKGNYLVLAGMLDEIGYVYRIKEDYTVEQASMIDLPTPTAVRFIYPEGEKYE